MSFGDQRELDVVIQARNQLAPGLMAANAELSAFHARNSGLIYGAAGGAGGLLGFEERRALGMFPGMGQAAGLAGFTPGMMAIGGAGLAATGLFAGAKDLVNRYREEERAVADLQQAYTSAGADFGKAQQKIEDWIAVNSPYIQNVNQAREGFAALTRSGLQQNVVMQAMNEALNLSAIKHIDLNTAVEVVTKAYQGQGKGLLDLGIHMSQFDGTTGLLNKHVLNQAQLTQELNAKLAGGVGSVDKLTRTEDVLNFQMDKLAHDAGPKLEDLFIRLANAILPVISLLDALVKNNSLTPHAAQARPLAPGATRFRGHTTIWDYLMDPTHTSLPGI